MNNRLRTRVRRTTPYAVALAAIAAVAQGCANKPPPATTPSEQAIVVRDLSGGIDGDFAFEKVIGKILTTAQIADTPANRVALVQSMLDSFDSDSMTNPTSNLPMKVDLRPKEKGLGAAALLAGGVTPIGLFNRLDLAPADWSDCGEHRIVYATKPGASNARFFLIFEAKLPNPDPSQGMKGCEAVAKRWRDIGAASQAGRKALLNELYFTGLPGFEPVVHHLNYGAHLGQVRANMFVGNNPGADKWQLREFRVLPVAADTLAFAPGPVANNPLAEFYRDAGGTPAEQAERTRFHTAFKATYAPALTDFDAKAAAGMSPAAFREGLFNCMGAPIQAADNEFQSDSLPATDEPAALAGAAFKASLPASWSSPDGSRTVSRDELLNRAGVVTCGGCHQFSSTRPVGVAGGATLTWPQPSPGGFFFVHISEEMEPGTTRHVISTTLRDVFVPHRQKVLQSILAGENPGKHCAVTTVTASASAAPSARAEAASRREAAEAAQRVLRPAAVTASAAREAAAQRVKALSDAAHARDQQKRGAAVAFRRPH